METKNYIVVYDNGLSCCVETTELGALNTVHNLIQGGYDKSEIAVYETGEARKVNISLS